ncbi:MAG TPA: MBL fold metallo-hydrolase [Pyrinomonadaceae bacterium]|jgi:hypothetical protein|nr:MBL fold metallo-hydrolase [Pyrinomonadaceae bacterium]
MSTPVDADSTTNATCAIHLLDVDTEEYGDAVLCVFGDTSVLIDGAHRSNIGEKPGYASIPAQIGKLLKQDAPPYSVDLLVVTHAHLDHVGCLPDMVEQDLLRASWALVSDPDQGWGRTGDSDAAPQPDGLGDERARMLAAALREEPLTDFSNRDAVAQLLSDAIDLEASYRRMLDNLKNKGGDRTKVVRYGSDSPAKLSEIQTAFKKIGLKVLGPTRAQLIECARLIGRRSQDAVGSVSDFFSSRADADADVDLVDAYKNIVAARNADAADANSRPGPPINLQSIVTRFKFRNRKFLFAGDMQLARPETGGQAMKEMIARLLDTISADGPYDFAKLSHHGSDNGFNEEIYEALGKPKLLGICAGSKSTAHPNKETLTKLRALKRGSDLTWARTDRNKLSTFTFTETTEKVEVKVKPLNVATPNKKPTEDVITEGVTETTKPRAPEAASSPVVVSPAARPGAPGVEVFARIPHEQTRVTITVDVEPRGGRGGAGTVEARAAQTGGQRDEGSTATAAGGGDRPGGSLNIAAGRTLPRLLFVTSSESLTDRIGRSETQDLMDSLRGAHLVLDLPRNDAQESRSAAPPVQRALRDDPGIEGVVIVGGYNVVSAQKLFCIPQELRAQLLPGDIINDQDHYLVWSDDVYGDRDGSGFPQLPVSRIPDGRSNSLIVSAIQARNSCLSSDQKKDGVRNKLRPFADAVYKIIPGVGELRISAPVSSKLAPPYNLDGDFVYLMLHGDYADSTCFLGEEKYQEFVEAVSMSNVREKNGAVVFTGCCWGALTATPALLAMPGEPIAQKNPNASLAMKFMLGGANAFIGCTGTHYSPEIRPGREGYIGAGFPMHLAFWRILQSIPYPAKALHQAKIAYLNGMPYSQSPEKQAIEHKILREYTCLGLGW